MENIALKAKKIIETTKQSVADFEQCLHAGICPTCGENLKLRMKEKITPRKNIFGFSTSPNVFKYEEIFCSNGHKLIHPIYGERTSAGCIEYFGCANKEIEEYNRCHYSLSPDANME